MDETQAMREAIAHVKQKQEHHNIPDSFVQMSLERVRAQLPPAQQKKLAERIANAKDAAMLRKSPAYEEWFKSTRAWLRRAHGMWYADEQETARSREARMQEFLAIHDPSLRAHALQQVIAEHPSTRERTGTDYEKIMAFCFDKLQCPAKGYSIIDLGCGINIASAAHWPKTSAYIGYDIMPAPEQFANAVASAYKFKAIMRTIDLGTADPAEITKLTHKDAHDLGIELPFDVCMVWKTADVLESQKRGAALRLLRAAPSRRLVVSFATRSLGGKKRIDPRTRAWFIHFLEHERWQYDTLETASETFLRIDK